MWETSKYDGPSIWVYHGASRFLCSSQAVPLIVFCRIAYPGIFSAELGVQCLWGCHATNRLQLKIILFTSVFHERFIQEFWWVHGSLKGAILPLHWVALPELILDTLRDFYEKKSQRLPLCYIFVKSGWKSWKTLTLNQRNIPNAYNWL